MASDARPYIIVGSAGYIVGATIGRPLLSLGRKSVTVPVQYNLFPMQVALLPHGSGARPVGSFGYLKCRNDKAAYLPRQLPSP